MRALLVLFFVSGAVGLGYQVLWSRWLLQLVGASAPTHAVVLAAFMGGLALGARWLGPVADRMRSPLRLYVGFELGLAVWALAWPALAAAAERLAGDQLVAGGTTGLLVRALLAGLLLLPPTIAMGATWPAVTRHAVRELEQVGRRGAGLYSVNAAGAVVGALAMAYVLLPLLGLSGCLALLALLNVALAALAWQLARRPLVAPATAPEASAGRAREAALSAWALALVLFLAGTLSFVHEIAWVRLFSIALGSSTHSFAVMVASFVAGIALGSALIARHDERIVRPLRLLAWTQLAAGVFVLLVLPAGQYLPWLFGRLAQAMAGSSRVFALNELAKLLACGAVLLPLALFVGAAIPLALKSAARRKDAVARDAGRLYAANTIGNVVGALAAGLLLLPWLGMERLLLLTSAASLLLGFGLLLRWEPSNRARAIGGGLAAGALAWSLLAGGWNPAWFTFTPVRQDVPELAAARDFVEGWEVLYERDDPATHVLVTEARGSAPPYRVLFVNGKPDASSGEDMPTQALLAHLPLVLHPHAKDVTIVGLASGVTAGAALQHPIESLEVVDLVAAMRDVSGIFGPWNHRPLLDERTRFVVDDGRNRILHGEGLQDVIISEPSNPWVAGVGSLYSREFYDGAARRLRADGCFVQWLQGYELSDDTLCAVVRTFRLTFPHVRVFTGAGRDMLLVGRLTPFEPDWEALRERIALPAVRDDLASVGVSDLESLLDRELLSPVGVDWLAAQTRNVNTDDNLLLEHRAPRELFERGGNEVVTRLDERALRPPSRLRSRLPARAAATTVPPELPREPQAAAAWLGANAVGVLSDVAGRPDVAAAWSDAIARAAETATQPSARGSWALFRVDVLLASGRTDEALVSLEALLDSDVPPSAEGALLRACRSGRAAACPEAIERHRGELDASTLSRFLELRESSAAVR